MPDVEEEPSPGAEQHERDKREPGVVGPVDEREVPGEHREQHGQRQIVVVHRSALGVDARRRVRLTSRLLRADQLPVCGDDVEEHVPGHHRAEHRADLEVRGPWCEEPAAAPGRECGQAHDAGAE